MGGKVMPDQSTSNRVLWREWEHCTDADMARAVFELLQEEPGGRIGACLLASRLAMCGAAWGASAGLWIESSLLNFVPRWNLAAIPGFLIAVVVGTLAGCVVGWRLGQRWRWRRLLDPRPGSLTPNGSMSPFIAWYLLLLAAVLVLIVTLSLANAKPAAQAAVPCVVPCLAVIQTLLLSLSFLAVRRYRWCRLMNGMGLFPWFGPRPDLTQLADAVRRRVFKVPSGNAAEDSTSVPAAWLPLVARLQKERERPVDLESALRRLEDADWRERWLAGYALLALGGAAAWELHQRHWGRPRRLQAVSPEPGLHDTRRRHARWLLQSVADATAKAYPDPESWICTRCFTRGTRQSVRVGFLESVVFPGCARCHATSHLVKFRWNIVAVLDETEPREWWRESGNIAVNCGLHLEPFGFDVLEIRRATDRLIEQWTLVFMEGTDRSPPRADPAVECVIVPECPVSPNTLAILRGLFRRVRVGKVVSFPEFQSGETGTTGPVG